MNIKAHQESKAPVVHSLLDKLEAIRRDSKEQDGEESCPCFFNP